jgi:hypothetical protein
MTLLFAVPTTERGDRTLPDFAIVTAQAAHKTAGTHDVPVALFLSIQLLPPMFSVHPDICNPSISAPEHSFTEATPVAGIVLCVSPDKQTAFPDTNSHHCAGFPRILCRASLPERVAFFCHRGGQET